MGNDNSDYDVVFTKLQWYSNMGFYVIRGHCFFPRHRLNTLVVEMKYFLKGILRMIKAVICIFPLLIVMSIEIICIFGGGDNFNISQKIMDWAIK